MEMYDRIKKDITQEYYVKQNLLSAKIIPGVKEVIDSLNKGLQMSKDDFKTRWSAD